MSGYKLAFKLFNGMIINVGANNFIVLKQKGGWELIYNYIGYPEAIKSTVFSTLMFQNPEIELFARFHDNDKDAAIYNGQHLFIKEENKLKEGDTLIDKDGCVFQVIRQAMTDKLFLHNINMNVLCNYDLTKCDTVEKVNNYSKSVGCSALYMTNE